VQQATAEITRDYCLFTHVGATAILSPHPIHSALRIQRLSSGCNNIHTFLAASSIAILTAFWSHLSTLIVLSSSIFMINEIQWTFSERTPTKLDQNENQVRFHYRYCSNYKNKFIPKSTIFFRKAKKVKT